MKKTLILALTLLTGLVAESASAQDRLRIITNNEAYPLTISRAEKFAANTEFSTPVVEVVGAEALEQLCQKQGTPDLVVSTNAIAADKKAACAKNGVTELKISSDNGKQLFIYVKNNAQSNLGLNKLLSTLVGTDKSFKVSSL